MKGMLLALLLAVVGSAQAVEVEHQRGDFRFSTGPAPAYILDRDIPDTWDAAAPGHQDAHWRYWLYDEQVDHRGARDQSYSDHVFEPRSQSSLGDAGRFQINFNPEYQRLLIHRVELRRNGQWQDRLDAGRITLARREGGFERDMADGVVTALIVLDDVRVGDVIRVAYTVSGSNPILAGQSNDWLRLAWSNPVLDVHLRVLEEPGTKAAAHRENTDVEPVIREGADATEISLHAHGSAAVVDEQDYPSWFQPYPLVQVAPAQSWASVVAWAVPLYPVVDALPADLELKLVQWGKLTDPHARLTAALRTVQEEVRYFGVEMGENTHRPTAPAETWRRRYGDCKDKTYLLVTLLRRMGIEAVPALVATERGRAIADFVPSASVFNHVIVRAQVGRDVVWVDPTITLQGGEARDGDLSAYAMALPVVAGGDRLQAIEAIRPANARVQTLERYTPDSIGRNVKLTVETVYEGRSADYARRSTTGKRAEDLSRQYADYYRKRYGDVDVVDMPVRQDDLPANMLKITESYLLKAPFDNEGNLRALDVYGETMQGATALPVTMARTGPLDFAGKARYRHEVQIDLPERWKPTFGREKLAYQSSAFTYDRQIEVGDRQVKLVYEMEVGETEVGADKTAGHIGELRKLRDSLSARLRFSMPATDNAHDREQRLKNLLQDVLDKGSAK
jgi:hypothetical protein